jgi:hypothetical protein
VVVRAVRIRRDDRTPGYAAHAVRMPARAPRDAWSASKRNSGFSCVSACAGRQASSGRTTRRAARERPTSRQRSATAAAPWIMASSCSTSAPSSSR